MNNEEKKLFEDEVVLKTIKKLNEYYYLTPKISRIQVDDISAAINIIFLTTCHYLKIRPEIALTLSRAREYVYARHLAFYACRVLLNNRHASFDAIGKYIRPQDPIDHATVLCGVRSIRNLMQTDKNVKKDIETLLDLITKTKSEQLSKFQINGK